MDKLLTIKEAMEWLGVGRDWIKSRVQTGELRAIRLGKYLKFDPKDIERLIERSKISSLKTELEDRVPYRSRTSAKERLWRR